MDGYAVARRRRRAPAAPSPASPAPAPRRPAVAAGRGGADLHRRDAVPAAPTRSSARRTSPARRRRDRAEADVAPGRKRPAAGEDMRAGEPCSAPGGTLGPRRAGGAVAAGRGTLSAWPAARACRILCTGDELRAPGAPLGPGEIHNSNGPMLRAWRSQRGPTRRPGALVPDDPAATEAALSEALGPPTWCSSPAASRSAPTTMSSRRWSALGAQRGVLAGRAPARQADLVRRRRRGARLRAARQSGVGRGDVHACSPARRSPRCSAPSRRPPGPAPSSPSRCAPTPDRMQAIRVRLRGRRRRHRGPRRPALRARTRTPRCSAPTRWP